MVVASASGVSSLIPTILKQDEIRVNLLTEALDLWQSLPHSETPVPSHVQKF